MSVAPTNASQQVAYSNPTYSSRASRELTTAEQQEICATCPKLLHLNSDLIDLEDLHALKQPVLNLSNTPTKKSD